MISHKSFYFIFKGHDTTASAISWALHTLADHPEHQQKCYEEISKVLSGRDTDEILWWAHTDS